MKWRTILTAGAVIAVVTVPIVALAGADTGSVGQPVVAAAPGSGPAQCPLHDETAASPDEMGQWMASATHQDWMASTDRVERHSQMHGVEGPMHGDMMGGIGRGTRMSPGTGTMMGRDSMMGSGMGG